MPKINITDGNGNVHELHGFNDDGQIQYADYRTTEYKKRDTASDEALQKITEVVHKGKSIRFQLNGFSYDGTLGILLETVGEIVGQSLPGLYMHFPELIQWNISVDYSQEFVQKGSKKMPYAHSKVRVYVIFFKNQRMTTIFDTDTLKDVDHSSVGRDNDGRE